jgi:hypothetical protein
VLTGTLIHAVEHVPNILETLGLEHSFKQLRPLQRYTPHSYYWGGETLIANGLSHCKARMPRKMPEDFPMGGVMACSAFSQRSNRAWFASLMFGRR